MVYVRKIRVDTSKITSQTEDCADDNLANQFKRVSAGFEVDQFMGNLIKSGKTVIARQQLELLYSKTRMAANPTSLDKCLGLKDEDVASLSPNIRYIVKLAKATISDKKDDVATTSDKKDDVAITSDKKDDVAITSDKKDDVAITSDKKDDVAITSDKKDDVATTSDKKDDVAITSDKKDDVATTSDKKDDVAVILQEYDDARFAQINKDLFRLRPNITVNIGTQQYKISDIIDAYLKETGKTVTASGEEKVYPIFLAAVTRPPLNMKEDDARLFLEYTNQLFLDGSTFKSINEYRAAFAGDECIFGTQTQSIIRQNNNVPACMNVHLAADGKLDGLSCARDYDINDIQNLQGPPLNQVKITDRITIDKNGEKSFIAEIEAKEPIFLPKEIDQRGRWQKIKDAIFSFVEYIGHLMPKREAIVEEPKLPTSVVDQKPELEVQQVLPLEELAEVREMLSQVEADSPKKKQPFITGNSSPRVSGKDIGV